MFEHILVPLDGSRLAEDILGPVESLATHLGSRVTLLHVLERDPPETVHGEHHVADARDGASYLGRIADRLQNLGVEVDVHVHGRSVEDVVAAIDSHAHEFGADLVAMCKHGRTGWRDRLIGGIAQKLLRGGGTPILLRSPRDAPSEDAFQLRRILVPLEARHDPDAVLGAAVRLAQAYGASVRLLTVVPSLADARSANALARLLPGATTAGLRMEQEDAAAALRGHSAKLETEGVEVEVELREEEPSTGILESSDELPADLVVLGTHGRVSFEAWYTGSTGFRVISESARTLLLIREL